MANQSKKAVVLHSGGLDSTVCLLLAMKTGKSILSLGIDYGQRHRIELDYAAAQCRKYCIDRRVLRVEWDRLHLGIPIDRSILDMKASVSSAFLPARNAVFLTLACAEAAGINADEVWIGVNAIDFSGYPDCRPEFISAFHNMINIAGLPNLTITAPLLNMPKPEIAQEAKRLGIESGDTWSCYQPQFVPTGVVPCGRCDACVLHNHAWNAAFAGKE